MAIGEICSREVVFTGRDTTAKRAAQLMRETHVGSIVVVDEPNGRRVPTGIVTDRDIVVAVLALGLNPDAIQVGDVMNRKLLAVREDAGIAETIELMRVKGVRRVPVTNAGGALVGIVAADDVLSLLAEEMSALATMVSREHKREVEVRKKML
ncbi:MAG TPA: CBS domain-containing protein [Burkholderiales bacterium]|jgi:CBS domain-containing protein|nr:CBS domain-containing protein [Burkholderiales bacterium]